MKALVFMFIFCLGCVSISSAQVLQTESQQTSQELYDFHLERKRANNLGGWITLGGGLSMVVGAGVITYTDGGNHEKLAITGGVIALSSLYLFDRASKHRAKAQIQLQKGAVGLRNEFKYSGISVSITF